MEKQQEKKELLQWHPALYAGLQIELGEEAQKLVFENEHQLGTKPMEIDVLIIKKESESRIHKNIGRIYRKHNIIEYKSPDDSLSVDDFYKVHGYACFYKSDAGAVDSIPIEEITVSFISYSYPRKLMRHWENVLHYTVKEAETGIYYVYGAMIPIQIIVTRELDEEKNLWLRCLTKQLDRTETAERLIKEYGRNKSNKLYESVMNIIVSANKKKFQEAGRMCEALMEIAREKMKDELEAREKAGEERGEKRGEKRGEERGEKRGEKRGEERGEKRISALTLKLAEAGRTEDIIKAAKDRAYQKQLLEEFGL